MSTTMLKSLLATLALESQEAPKSIAEEAVADVAAEKVAEAEKVAADAAVAPTDTPPAEPAAETAPAVEAPAEASADPTPAEPVEVAAPAEELPAEEPTVTEEEVEKVEDVTQALESLCLVMESAVKSGKGYSRLELALHDTAVVGHCKRLKLQPPLRPSLESIGVHGAQAETQLVLESLESYVEKLREVALEARAEVLLGGYTLSQESLSSIFTRFLEMLKKLWEKIKQNAQKLRNWINLKLAPASLRKEIQKMNEIYKQAGVKTNATPQEVVRTIGESFGHIKEFEFLKDLFEEVSRTSAYKLRKGGNVETLLKDAETRLERLREQLNSVGGFDAVHDFAGSNTSNAAGQIKLTFSDIKTLVGSAGRAVSLIRSYLSNDKHDLSFSKVVELGDRYAKAHVEYVTRSNEAVSLLNGDDTDIVKLQRTLFALESAKSERDHLLKMLRYQEGHEDEIAYSEELAHKALDVVDKILATTDKDVHFPTVIPAVSSHLTELNSVTKDARREILQAYTYHGHMVIVFSGMLRKVRDDFTMRADLAEVLVKITEINKKYTGA